jgi:hypothetical protein
MTDDDEESDYSGTPEECGKKMLEKTAALEHEQWAHWTAYMLTVLCKDHPELNKDENVLRRSRQILVDYKDLTEKEKESDRVWARKAIQIFAEENKRVLDKICREITCFAGSPEDANEGQCLKTECTLAMTHVGCYGGNTLDTRVFFDGCLIESLRVPQESPK